MGRLKRIWIRACLVVVLLPLAVARVGSGAASTTQAEVPAATEGGLAPRDGLAPIMLASDGQFMWLLQRQQGENEGKAAGFQLLIHGANEQAEGQRGRWEAVQVNGTVFGGRPAALAMMTLGAGQATETRGYVFFPDGSVREFTRSDRQPRDSLPGKPEWMVASGSAKDGLWVLWRGPPAPVTAGTAPATAAATASATSPGGTRPGAESGGVSGREVWQLATYRDGGWTVRASPGPVGAADVPSAEAHPALLASDGRVWMVWADPSDPQVLRWREVGTEAGAAWSEPASAPLPEPVARPVCLAMNGQIRVLWAEREKTGRLRVAGLALTPAGAIDRVRPVVPMELGATSAGLDPDLDVALGREATSLLVVMAGRDGKLTSLVFDGSSGNLLEGPSVVEAQSTPAPDGLVAQNIVLVVMAALFCLVVWQWRRRPMAMQLPPGYKTALIRERLIGGLIDLALPAVGVAIGYGLFSSASFLAVGAKWWQGLRQPELLWETPEIRTFFAAYLGHVTLAELFTGRSIGKVVMGLRVVALDGTPPSALAIVVRNLVRIPELTMAFLLMYIFVTDSHQRLGDLAAQTLVVKPASEAGSGEAPKPGDGAGEG